MQGKWSEMLLIMIAEEIFAWSRCGDLQTIWSMRVQDRFELRVGRVIFGKKLLVHVRSKIRQIFLFHLFAEDLYLNLWLSWYIYFPFGVCYGFIMGEISSINILILALLLLLWGGL